MDYEFIFRFFRDKQNCFVYLSKLIIRRLGGNMNCIIIIVVVLLGMFLLVVATWFEGKKSYSFDELRSQLQKQDKIGEKLYYRSTFYFWERHKAQEIQLLYGAGKVIIDPEHVYEVEEVRGPYRCNDVSLAEELRFYVKEKKIREVIAIAGRNQAIIFEDDRIYFDTAPYVEELRKVYNNISVQVADESRRRELESLVIELYGRSNTICMWKLSLYIDLLRDFLKISNDYKNLSILSVMEEISNHINMGHSIEGKSDVGKETSMFNYNIYGGQVNIANENGFVSAVQNNSVDIKEFDVLVGNLEQNLDEIAREDAQTIVNEIERIREEIRKSEPNNKIISKGIATLTSMVSVVNGIPDLAGNLRKIIDYIRMFVFHNL